jgi:hypothetical protein
MAWYRTGTVSVTNGSTAVAGSGTNFVAGAQVGEGFAAPDGRLYEIVTIVSATSLTIGKAYLGSTQTGQTYEIVPTQSLVADLAGQVSTLISDFQAVADEAGEGKFDYGTAASPGITFTLDQDTGFFHDTNNEIGVSAGGTKVAEFNSGGLSVTGNVTAATADINGGTIDGVTIGGASAGAGTFTSVTGTSLNMNGAAVFNESGADVDFRIESDTNTHALFLQGSNGAVSVGTSAGLGQFLSERPAGAGWALAGKSAGIANEGGLFFDATNNGELVARNASGTVNVSLKSNGNSYLNGGNVGILTSSPTNALDVNSDSIRVRTSQTPATASATGNQGEIAWDAGYIYICVATNTWKRVAISTW